MKRSDIIRMLKAYQKKNAENYGILKLGLFGSVARKTHREHSDIAIVITLIAHLISNPCFEPMGHNVTFPFYVEADEIYNLARPAFPI